VLLWALVFLAVTPTVSQTPQFDEFHTWTDVATIYNFSERFRYDGDYGLRGVLTDSDWSLLYLRPSVRYRARPWLTSHGGAALFYNFFSGEDLPEIRPWVGARIVGPRPGRFAIGSADEFSQVRLTQRDDAVDALLLGRADEGPLQTHPQRGSELTRPARGPTTLYNVLQL
jgi:hypothetical protein